MSSSNPKLPAKAEALLKEWPLKEPEWEAFASRIIERARTASSLSSEEVTGAPFPAEPGEEGYVSSTRVVAEPLVAASAEVSPAAEAPAEPAPAEPAPAAPAAAGTPMSLADLARASVKKKTEGAKDIALESLMVATQQRAHVEEVAERVQAVSRAPKQSKPAPAEMVPPAGAWVEENQGAPSAPPPRQVAPVVQSPRGPWIVSGVAALAAAAALILALRKPDAVAPVQPQVTTIVQGPQAAAPNAPAAPAAPAPEQPRGGAELDQLPLEASKVLPAAPVAAKSGAGAPAPAAAAPSASATGVQPEAIVLEEEEPAPAPAEVASAPPAAAPAPSAAPLRPAELHSGGLPDKPSSGAVNAAIGSVMGAARACVAGQDGPSTARIVFGSDGKVQSVSVSGAAAGTAAAGCIESAFKKARVQPFAAPTFSIGATIRPN